MFENEPDDTVEEDEQFSIAIDDSVLTEALAAVEKRMGSAKRADDLEIGPLDLEVIHSLLGQRKDEIRGPRCEVEAWQLA